VARSVRGDHRLQQDVHGAVLAVAGNAKAATLTGRPYLLGGKGTPRPLMLTCHAGRGPLAQAAAQILALSKVDLNTDALSGLARWRLNWPGPVTVTGRASTRRSGRYGCPDVWFRRERLACHHGVWACSGPSSPGSSFWTDKTDRIRTGAQATTADGCSCRAAA
jgi:hypothetical protein